VRGAERGSPTRSIPLPIKHPDFPPKGKGERRKEGKERDRERERGGGGGREGERSMYLIDVAIQVISNPLFLRALDRTTKYPQNT
jgi:hypothetical protein